MMLPGLVVVAGRADHQHLACLFTSLRHAGSHIRMGKINHRFSLRQSTPAKSSPASTVAATLSSGSAFAPAIEGLAHASVGAIDGEVSARSLESPNAESVASSFWQLAGRHFAKRAGAPPRSLFRASRERIFNRHRIGLDEQYL